jgi:hypothetical protein
VGHTPAVYAHVATDPAHPGKLALQYWLFYVFNDWNNLHEGDWEMIQLVFDASSAAQALKRTPVEVGYSQHEGAEKAAWDDDKLDRVDGTHPVVHPASGSHANFFDEALYLGSSAEQGVGCADTRGPTIDVRPVLRTIPSDPAQARQAFPWIAFQGRWGELRPSFFNGPTGPNLKTQWTAPIEWSDGWRTRSYTVPGGGVFGPAATGFFCSAVGGGSRALVRLVDHPLEFGLLLAGLVLLAIVLLSRATWGPSAPLRVARRRAWGQILAAAARMYLSRFLLFVGIGVVFVPIALLVSLLQALVLHATNVLGVQTAGESNGLLAVVVLAIGTALTLLALWSHAGRDRPSAGRDRRGPADRSPAGLPPGRRQRRAAAGGAARRDRDRLSARELDLLAADRRLARRPLGPHRPRDRARARPRPARAPSERAPGAQAMAQGRLPDRSGWGGRVGRGAARRRGADPRNRRPFWLVNVIAGLVYALAMPFVALTTAYLYFDARARQVADEAEPAELPAEFGLSV